MVRKKNVLATVMQSFAITCLVTVLWMVVGYSLAFTWGGKMNEWIGGLNYIMLKGMTPAVVYNFAPNIPETVFMAFQMTFAIITPALIAGAFARASEILVAALVHGPVADPRLLPDRALGLVQLRRQARAFRLSLQSSVSSTSPAVRSCT